MKKKQETHPDLVEIFRETGKRGGELSGERRRETRRRFEAGELSASELRAYKARRAQARRAAQRSVEVRRQNKIDRMAEFLDDLRDGPK